MTVARTLFAALAVLGAPPVARMASACSCAPPAAEFEITPAGNAPVPLNARVRVSFRGVLPVGSGDPARLEVALRTRAGRKVDARVQVFRDGSGRDLRELAPRAPLRPDTVYEVVVLSSLAPSSRSILASETFRTGRAADNGAPQWRGIEQAMLWPGDTDPAGSALCRSFHPYGHLKIAAPVDPESSPVAFAVWVAEPGKAIAFDRPPLTYVTAANGHITIGSPGLCGHGILPFLEAGTRVGLRAADQAGNLSPPRETLLTLGHADAGAP